MQRHASGVAHIALSRTLTLIPNRIAPSPTWEAVMHSGCQWALRWGKETLDDTSASRCAPARPLIAQRATPATTLDRGRALKGQRVKFALFLVLLSGLMEICQLWIPGRNSELAGSLGSSAGAIIGIIAAVAIPSWLRPRARAIKTWGSAVNDGPLVPSPSALASRSHPTAFFSLRTHPTASVL